MGGAAEVAFVLMIVAFVYSIHKLLQVWPNRLQKLWEF